MTTRDLLRNIKGQIIIPPQENAGGTTNAITSETIDTLHYDSLKVELLLGDPADVTSAILQESDDDASYSDVAAADYTPDSEAQGATTDTDSLISLGYRGNKRYVQLVVVCNGTTQVAAVAELGHPHIAAV